MPFSFEHDDSAGAGAHRPSTPAERVAAQLSPSPAGVPFSELLLFADPPAPEAKPEAKPEEQKLETGELKGIEILAAGTWTTMTGKKVTFTTDDLKAIAATYNELSDRVKPTFKLGHIPDDQQKLATGYPALGWLQNVRAKGDKLVADITRIPKKVLSLIEAGSYRRISAEIARGWTDAATGKVHDMVLTAAGLLGASAPAISTLKDVMNLYGRPIEGELPAVEHIALADFVPQGGTEMDPKEIQAMVDKAVETALKKNTEDVTAKFTSALRETLGLDEKADPLAAVKELKTENAAIKERVAKSDAEKFAAERDGLILKGIQAGKIAPAAKDSFVAMVDGWAAKGEKLSFSVGDKKLEGTVIECLAQYIEALPQVLPAHREFGKGKVTTEKKENPVASVSPDVLRFAQKGLGAEIGISGDSIKRDQMVKDYMSEHKVTDYCVAYAAVFGGASN